MMTKDAGVKRNVLDLIKKMVRPGQIVTKKLWREAYNIVRHDAIDEIVEWKRKHITIEEPWNG